MQSAEICHAYRCVECRTGLDDGIMARCRSPHAQWDCHFLLISASHNWTKIAAWCIFCNFLSEDIRQAPAPPRLYPRAAEYAAPFHVYRFLFASKSATALVRPNVDAAKPKPNITSKIMICCVAGFNRLCGGDSVIKMAVMAPIPPPKPHNNPIIVINRPSTTNPPLTPDPTIELSRQSNVCLTVEILAWHLNTVLA